MSALPRPRPPGAGAAAPWRAGTPAIPWVDALDPIWEDPDLDIVEKGLYTQLRRWLFLHPGWWPTFDMLGRLIGRSRQTVARILDRLHGAGYVLRRADGGFELAVPSPRAGRWVPADELQGLLFEDEPRPPMDGIRPPVDVVPPARPPHTPPESGESQKTTTDVVGESSSCFTRVDGSETEIPGELLDALVAEAVRVFGFEAEAAAMLVRDTIRDFRRETRKPEGRRQWSRFDPAWIMEALRRAYEGRERAKVFDWGYLFGILRTIAKRGGPEPAPAPRPSAKAERDAAAEERRRLERAREREADEQAQQREGRLRAAWDGLTEPERESIRAAVKAANPGIVRWPNMLEPLYLAELEKRMAPSSGIKTPAAEGHSAKFPPPPVRELVDILPPASSYREQEFTANATGDSPPLAQHTPGESHPRPPLTGGASVPSRGAPGGGRGEAVRVPDDPSPLSLSLAQRLARLVDTPGAHPARGAGAVADRPSVSSCAPPSAVHNAGRADPRQRHSDEAPRPHPRE